jgi:VIT1/CCC1 family predicted Fe2+/Mn2+ transporter
MSVSPSKKKQFGFMFAGLVLCLLALLFENVSEVVVWSLVIFGMILGWIGWVIFMINKP